MNIPNPYLFYTGSRRSRFARRNMVRGANRRPSPGEDPAAYFREVAQETITSQEYAIGTSHHIAHLAGRGDLAPD
ncbi:hypothetical protein SAMN05421805_1011101 [Saccharopolyspora antimicrobica]|uniref:Uncharacterized protein n=2 Tax=Saccharopolyspora antimicrobica TaxID=455193 RepID=A0A1I4SQB4_9PSEU|nr:hypothetical protein ATL45_4403 [Saccharopolyspora antimicrobica]SFM66718.1 hypothetical protein SAMN05421805_1011101 [Saccharopolyspora antimicrobica]